MKVKVKELATKLLPQIHQMGDLQKKGLMGLSQKATYAVAKNFNNALDLIKPYEKHRQDLISKHVQINEHKKPLTEQAENGQVDYVFISEDDKNAFIKEIEAALEQEVEFTPYKFSQEELEACHNIPVDALAVLMDMQIITEINLAHGLHTVK